MLENSVFRATYHGLLQCIALSWSKLPNISDNKNNNVLFFGRDIHLQRLPYHWIGPCFAQNDNNKMWAAKETSHSK